MKIDKVWFWLFAGPVLLWAKFAFPPILEAYFAAQDMGFNDGRLSIRPQLWRLYRAVAEHRPGRLLPVVFG